MLTIEDLNDRSSALCAARAATELGGSVRAEGPDAAVRWDSVRLRHVASRRLQVWRELTEIDVVLDAGGRVVGFVDAGRWAGCAAAAITDEAIAALAHDTGLFARAPELLARSEGSRGAVVARLSDGAIAYRAVVNPARAVLIELAPEDLP